MTSGKTPVIEQVTPVMKVAPSINEASSEEQLAVVAGIISGRGISNGSSSSRSLQGHRAAAFVGTGESHASASERSAAAAETLQRSAMSIVGGAPEPRRYVRETVEVRASTRFSLLSRGDVSSQRSIAPCPIAFGSSFR